MGNWTEGNWTDYPTDDEIDLIVQTEEGFRTLVGWLENDIACGAPTGAPTIEWLEDQAAARGYDASIIPAWAPIVRPAHIIIPHSTSTAWENDPF